MLACGHRCTSEPRWLCINGSCQFRTPPLDWAGEIYDTEVTCQGACGITSGPGFVCYPGEGCLFEPNAVPGENVYFFESDCVANCPVTVNSTNMDIGPYVQCDNAGIRRASVDDSQYYIWCEKFRTKNNEIHRYKGTDGRVISDDGSNCPRIAKYLGVDGDGCRYCTPISHKILSTYSSRKTGNSSSDSKVIIGNPGEQGNCSRGYVVEIEDLSTGLLKCTTEGFCNPPTCTGITLAPNNPGDILGLLDSFSEVSRFIGGGTNVIQAESDQFVSDELYNFTIFKRSSSQAMVPNTNLTNTLFGSRVVDKIREVSEQFGTTQFDSSLPSEVTFDRIRDSLSSSAKRKINHIRRVLGDTIPEHQVYLGIKNYLFNGEGTFLNEEDLNFLVNNTHKESSEKTFLRNLVPTVEEKISYALTNKRSLNYENNDYSTNQKKLLENIYIPPEELFETFTVYSLSGSAIFDVNNDYTIDVLRANGTTVNVPVNPDHTVTVQTNGLPFRLPTNNNLANTYSLDNFEHSVILNWEDIDRPYRLDVSTDASDKVEFSYAKSVELPDVLILQLIPSSIEFTTETDNPIKTTVAEYRYVSDIEGDTEFLDGIKHRMGPWLSTSISYQDPILPYITEGIDPVIKLTGTTFSLNEYGSELGEITFVSKVPYFIYITPTNKFSRNPFGRLSTMESLTHRRLLLDWGFLKSDTNTGLSTPLEANYAYNNGNLGIRGVVDTQAVEFTYNPIAKLIKLETNFVNGEKPARNYSGLRTYNTLLERIKLAYNLENEELVSQFDVFSRFNARQYFTFFNSTPETLDTIREAIEADNGVRVVEVAKKDLVKSKLLSLKSGQTEIASFITPTENFEKFGGKYG